jgi:hypothetical protein
MWVTVKNKYRNQGNGTVPIVIFFQRLDQKIVNLVYGLPALI